MNSTATCCASHALPPLPITQSLCPSWNCLAICSHSSAIWSAHCAKNRSLISTDSRHLRRTFWLRSLALTLTPLPSDSMGILSRPQMAAIGVISGAGAFGGDHGRAKRSLRRAKGTESGTVVRLLDPLQDLPADADRGLLGIDFLYFEEPLRVMIAKFVTQPVTAFRNRSDAAPFAVADLEHLRYKRL